MTLLRSVLYDVVCRPDEGKPFVSFHLNKGCQTGRRARLLHHDQLVSLHTPENDGLAFARVSVPYDQ